MLDSLGASVMIECEDAGTMQLVRGILDLFPAKRHLGQALADLLMHHNYNQVKERTRLEQELRETREYKDTNVVKGNLLDKRRSELDR